MGSIQQADLVLAVMIKKKKYLPFFALILLTSCETLVNTIPEDKLPKTDSQLTLFCFISPQDTVIRVKVGQTNPLFSEYSLGGGSYHVVDGDTIRMSENRDKAVVTLSDGERSVVIPYSSASLFHALPASKFPIRAGSTYTLTVKEGSRTAQATCTIPREQVPIKKYSLDTVITSSFGRRDTALVTSFAWDDPAGTANYYRVKAYEEIEVPTFTFDPGTKKYNEGRAKIQIFYSSRRNDGRSDLQNDASLDGTSFSSVQFERRLTDNQFLYNVPYVDGKRLVPERGPVSLGVHLLLNNTDKAYYEFHRTLRQARNENPFSEPSLVYTNVRGGFGVFAGYNQSVRVVKP